MRPSLEAQYQINNILRLGGQKLASWLNFNLIIFSLQGDSGQPGVPGELVCDLWPWSTPARLNSGRVQILIDSGQFKFCLSGFAWDGWVARPQGGQGRVRHRRTERNQGESLSNVRQHTMNFPFSLTSWWLKPENGSFRAWRQALFHLHEWSHKGCQLGGNLAESGFYSYCDIMRSWLE